MQSPFRFQTEQERSPLLRVPKPLPITQLQTTATTIYTVGDKADFEVGGLIVSNVTVGADSVTIYFVPSGGTAGTANTVVGTLALAANTTERLTAFDGMILSPGTIIQALCGANNAVNLTGWGWDYQGAYS